MISDSGLMGVRLAPCAPACNDLWKRMRRLMRLVDEGSLKTLGRNLNEFQVRILLPVECTPMPEISTGLFHPLHKETTCIKIATTKKMSAHAAD